MFSYYKVLYKVIIILLITIFVLLLFMLVVCIRFTDDDYYKFWTRRTPRTTIRSPSAPQLFTVSVPGQASMPKLNLVSRGDLYDRYNINANISVVDETAANTSGELPPPPPYTPPYTEYAVVSPNRH